MLGDGVRRGGQLHLNGDLITVAAHDSGAHRNLLLADENSIAGLRVERLVYESPSYPPS